MDPPVIAYLIPYLLSAGTSAAIGAYAWGRHSVPGSRQFGVLAMAQAVATFGYIFELASTGLVSKIFWENIQTVALFVWPVAYLAFAIRYSDRELPDGKIVWAVLVAPFVIFLALLFTDPLRGLIREQPHLEAGEPFAALIFGYSLPIYLAGIYSYIFIIAALYLLGKKYLNSSPLNRGQVGTVIAGTLIPVVVGIVTATGIRFTFQRDPTPVTFALGNLVVAWGLYRYQLFDLVPSGRMLILRAITDRKRLENELGQHRAHLEELVTERTEDLSLANEQLQHEVDERSRAERDLRASESRTFEFLNALPIAVIVVGTDTKLHYMNDFAMELYRRGKTTKPPLGPDDGRPLAEVLSEIPTYIIDGDPLPHDQSPSLRALQGERVRLDNVGEERIPLEMLSVPIRNENGEIEFALTTIQDISERRRLEESLSAIYSVGRDLALIRDEAAIGRRVVEEAHHILNFEAAGFGLADEPACELLYGYSILGIDEEDTVLRLPLDGKEPQSISAKVYRTGELINVLDVSKEPLYHSGRPGWEGRSELCVPVRVGDRILGVLNAESRQLNRFSQDDERLMQALADQCGVAVENARLYGEIQDRLREQTALQNAVSSISSTIELDRVLNEIAKSLGETIDATSVFICAYDETHITTEVQASFIGMEANEKERGPTPIGPIAIPEFFPGTLEKLQENQPAVSYADDPDLPEAQRTHYNDYDTLTSLFIPMRIGGRLIAYADLWDSRERREFSPQEIALCEGIAQQAAVAMENARLYAQAQDELIERRRVEEKLQQHQEELEDLVMERTAKLSEASERLATLNDASRVLGVASVDSEQIHIAIHRAVSWLMSAEIFSISVFDNDRAEVEDVYSVGIESRELGSRYPVENTMVDHMLRRGSSLRIDDVPLLEASNPVTAYLETDTRSALAVLLPGSDQSMGILLAQANGRASYSEEDEKILEMLAAHAATALENAQLYQVARRAAADEERQRLARQLHDSVTQSLYSLALMTNGWAAMSDKDELKNPAESFRQLEQLSVQALSEMRLLIHQLRPTVLEETGLVGALQERLEAVEHRVGLETQLQTEGDMDRLSGQVVPYHPGSAK